MGSGVHLLLSYSFVLLAISNAGKMCEDLDARLFSNCIKAGIASTIKIPSNESKLFIRSTLTRQTIQELKSCSPYIDFLVCSVSTPKCIEGVYSPILPCRRVCMDVMRGCDLQRVRSGDVEWLKGLCKLLPDEDVRTKKCIEPEGFEPLHEKVQLQQKCSKLFLPQCKGLGFNYTTKSYIEQLYLSQHFDTALNDTRSSRTTRCDSVLRELLCTELVPACFKGNQSEPAIYTVCRSRCNVLWTHCPEVFKKQLGIFEDCTMTAENKTDYEGFCKVTEWPGANKWRTALAEFHELVLTNRHKQEPEISPGAVIISLAVVISLSLLAAVVYNFYKKKMLLSGYYRHGNEEETEMTAVVVS